MSSVTRQKLLNSVVIPKVSVNPVYEEVKQVVENSEIIRRRRLRDESRRRGGRSSEKMRIRELISLVINKEISAVEIAILCEDFLLHRPEVLLSNKVIDPEMYASIVAYTRWFRDSGISF